MNLTPLTIQITDDFDLDKILSSGQCFRPEKRADGWYRFLTGTHLLYLRPQGQGSYAVQCEPGTWDAVWSRYFDLERSYSALRQRLAAQCAAGDFLSCALAEGEGLRILRQEPWEMLVTFLISQRKSIPAIRKAVNLLSDRFGEAVEGAGETVHLFPTAERLAAVPEEVLAACGLGYRTRYVANAARQAASGALDLAAMEILPDEELFARLLTLEGVGKKVANCVCLFGYGRTAMVPVDVWIDRLIREEFGGHDPFPAYGQEAGIVQQYLFCCKRQQAKSAKKQARSSPHFST